MERDKLISYFTSRFDSDHTFLVDGITGQEFSYRSFLKNLRSIAADLPKVDEDEVVVLEVQNDRISILMFFALLFRGIRFILTKKNTNPQVVASYGQQLNVRAIISGTDVKEWDGPKNEHTTISRNVAYIVFTSGSTGTPKGIQITYSNMISEIESMVNAYGLEERDVHMCVLPIYHASGLYRNVLMAVHCRSTTVLCPSVEYESFWEIIEKYAVTFTQVTPTILRGLISRCGQGFQVPGSLRFIGSASAPHSSELVSNFEKAFNIPLYLGYGMTEATCGITLSTSFPKTNSSVGLPIDVVDLKIHEPNKQGTGEVTIAGKNIMLGYLDSESSDKIKMIGGRLFTGDLGRILKDGSLELVGRKNDIIKRGDFRINLLDIEKELCRLSYVSEAVVLDVEHPIIGKDIVGFITMTKNSKYESKNSNQILKDIKPHLDPVALPSEVVVVEELPKFDQLKINRVQLRKDYERNKSK